MNPVEQLIADLQAGSIADADALYARIAELDNEELAAFEAAAADLVDGIIDGSVELEDGAERMPILNTLADAVDATRGEAHQRFEAAAAEEAELEVVRQRIHGETQPEGGEGDGGDTPPAETPPEGGEEGGDGEGGETPPAETPPVEQTAEQGAEGELVTAATRPAAPVTPRISRVAVRTPANAAPRPRQGDERRTVMTASADVPGFSSGQEIGSLDELAEAMVRRADPLRGLRLGEGVVASYMVASVTSEYPEEQRLSRDAAHNEEVITAALGTPHSPSALVAAGGVCAPPTPLYDQLSIAEDARPARAALPSFQADRGGILFMPPPTWTDYQAGVRRWTQTNDTEALTNANVRKPCVRVDCDETVTEETYAIPMCVTVGNFFARTYDERVQAILNGLGAWQARFAEQLVLDKMGSESTAVSAGQTLGATRDILAVLDRAVASYRYRQRVGDNFRLEFWLPRWTRDMMRADLVRALPVSGASLEENLAVADAQLEAFFARRMVNITWLWEGEPDEDQAFGNEAGGSLQNWPSTVIGYLFHPGAFLFLDGGTLDLGVQRDSTLNASNDLQIWMETFEGLAFRGIESLRITLDLCPSGEIAGTTDVTGAICTTGS